MAETYQFTDEDRSKGGKRGSEVQRQKREERYARSLVVHEIVSEAEDLSPETLAGALTVARLIREGSDALPMESWLDAQRAANVAEILHRVHRLASGQSTSNVAHASLTDDERRERLARLAAGDVTAVGDTPSPTDA